MLTTRFWNNLQQTLSFSKDWKAKENWPPWYKLNNIDSRCNYSYTWYKLNNIDSRGNYSYTYNQFAYILIIMFNASKTLLVRDQLPLFLLVFVRLMPCCPVDSYNCLFILNVILGLYIFSMSVPIRDPW